MYMYIIFSRIAKKDISDIWYKSIYFIQKYIKSIMRYISECTWIFYTSCTEFPIFWSRTFLDVLDTPITGWHWELAGFKISIYTNLARGNGTTLSFYTQDKSWCRLFISIHLYNKHVYRRVSSGKDRLVLDPENKNSSSSAYSYPY